MPYLLVSLHIHTNFSLLCISCWPCVASILCVAWYSTLSVFLVVQAVRDYDKSIRGVAVTIAARLSVSPHQLGDRKLKSIAAVGTVGIWGSDC